MRQEDVANEIDVSQGTVSNVGRGKKFGRGTATKIRRWLREKLSTRAVAPRSPSPPPTATHQVTPEQTETAGTAPATETAPAEASADEAPAPAPSPAPAPVSSARVDTATSDSTQQSIAVVTPGGQTPPRRQHPPQEDVYDEVKRLRYEIEELRTYMAPAADGRVRVASWNICRFKYEGTDVEDTRIANLAASIIGGNFDVVVIQEVVTGQYGQLAVNKLRTQLGDPWRFELSAEAGSKERYAVLWRSTFSELQQPKMHLIKNLDVCVELFELSEAASDDVRAFWRQFKNDVGWPGSRGFCFISFECLALLTFHTRSSNDPAANKCEVVALQAIATAAKISEIMQGKTLVVCGDANVDETQNKTYWLRRIGFPPQERIFAAFNNAFGDPALSMEATNPTNLFPIAAAPKHNDVMFAAHCGDDAPDIVLVNGGTAPIPSAVVEAAGKSGASDQSFSIESPKTPGTRKYRGATNAARKVWSDHRPVYCDVSLPTEN